ncbi:MAG: maleylacetoacetate isomerase [Pseudomonadota bacterium]
MPLTLYSNFVNSAGERVRIALGLKQIPYEYIAVRDIGIEAYRKINPQGLMPTLLVDKTPIAQATAILEYLEETYPARPLLPTDPFERARVRGFAQHVTSEMHAIDVNRVRGFLETELGLDQAARNKWSLHWFHTGFRGLEKTLANRDTQTPFCFGEQPAWADIHLVPQVHKGISRFKVNMSDYPFIHGIYRRCYDLPEFAAARPENQPDWPGEIPDKVIPW